MAKKVPTWLIGCGIGCLVIVGIVVTLAVASGVFLRNSVKGLQEASDTREELDRQYGQPGEFRPAADGSIPADRMEIFLAVRDATQPARLEIVRTFQSFPMTEEEARELESKSFFEKIGSVFKIGGTALQLPRAFGKFFQERNQSLIENQMGMGEYTYIYVLAYYGALGHSPQDGPEGHKVSIDTGDGVKRSMGHSPLSGRIQGDLIDMLSNQLAAIPAETDPDGGAWRRQLRAEIDALDDDPLRIPWQDGLPQAIADSIAPYRERLEKSYERRTNEFELARNRKRGNWSVTAD